MKTGLLWFDDDPRKQLEEKVLQAAACYERKYGQSPNLCFVHPGAFGDDGKRRIEKAGGVEIRVGCSVLPHHFWIGVDEEREAESRSLVSRARSSHRPTTPKQMVMEMGDA